MAYRCARNRRGLRCAGLALVLIAASAIGGEGQSARAEHERPNVPTSLQSGVSLEPLSLERLEQKGMSAGSAVMVRIFKAESELELWVQARERFELFATYPICFWSGTLGPKLREGDRQAPEGLYSVGIEQLHRDGRRPRSFDIGFPNALDQSEGRTGSNIWVHGGCASRGCYAMTNPVMDEIFVLGEQALAAGQERFQVHIFPFRMSEENMRMHADSPWHPFWRNLKLAYDAFESARMPPKIAICGKRYVVEQGGVGGSNPPPPIAAPDTLQIACEETLGNPAPVLSNQSASAAPRGGKRRKASLHRTRARHTTARRNRHAAAPAASFRSLAAAAVVAPG